MEELKICFLFDQAECNQVPTYLFLFKSSWTFPTKDLTGSIQQIQLWCPRSKWNMGEILAFLA